MMMERSIQILTEMTKPTDLTSEVLLVLFW